ncbi:DivIVA domain-containing protein [Holzapfeliella floricola]|uniref:DivIVA domain-containing protein n=1 Tax=Holzapfeliella floricola TaxID=679249 RepID=UPI0007815729|nr:DivIVA domain-containing protein [Holzapfeliella floricola]
MNLTPKDIHEKDFQRKMWGYDPDQVDEFLDQVIVDYSDLLKEVDQLKQERQIMHQQLDEYDHKKNSLNDSIISAQEVATQIKNQAQTDSNKLVSEAKQYVESLKEETSQRLQHEESQAQSKIKSLNNDYELLKQRILETRQEYGQLLQTQLEEFQSDDWQYFLDKYFGRQRIYPANGEEPISVNDLDTSDDQEVQSEHNNRSSEDTNTEKSNDDGPVIVFPDDYKKTKLR